MGWTRNRKPHRSRPDLVVTDGIDLLSFAFNIPTRRDLLRHRELEDDTGSPTPSSDDSSTEISANSSTDDENDHRSVQSPRPRHVCPDDYFTRSKLTLRKVPSHLDRKQDSTKHLTTIYEKSRLNSLPNRCSSTKASHNKISRRTSTNSRSSPQRKAKNRVQSCTNPPSPAVATRSTTATPPDSEPISALPKTSERIATSSPVSMSPQYAIVQTPPGLQGHAVMHHPMSMNQIVASCLPPLYFAPSGSFAAQYVTPSPQDVSCSKSGSDLEEIQRIQNEINNLEQSQLRLRKEEHAAELKKLHIELNATLDAATWQAGAADNIHQRGVQAQSASQGPHQNHAVRNLRTSKSEGLADTGVRDVRSAQSATTLKAPVLQSHGSPETLQHHLCSNCGNVRSSKFHQKHPLRTGQKAVINYCDSCRVIRTERNDTEIYHICFGCGRVRSKVYQDAHPITEGLPILPNYCRKCVAEAKEDEAVSTSSICGAEGSLQIPVPNPELLAQCRSPQQGDRVLDDNVTHPEQPRVYGKQYKRPFVEDSSTIAPEGDIGEHESQSRRRPCQGGYESVPASLPLGNHRRHPSLRSEGSSVHSSSRKNVGFDFEAGNRHKSRLCRPSHIQTEAFSSANLSRNESQRLEEEEADLDDPDRSKVPRFSSPVQASTATIDSSPDFRGPSRLRSAFAGMPFRQRNQFGPPRSRTEAVDAESTHVPKGYGHAYFELPQSSNEPVLNSSPGAFSRSAIHKPEQDPGHLAAGGDHDASSSPERNKAAPSRYRKGKGASNKMRSRGGSLHSSSTSAYTAFTPTSPNPYYTPQTSPSLYEEGIFERMRFQKRHPKRTAYGQMYEPIPITEEFLSVMSEEAAPILYIDCVPYSDVTDSISSPDYESSLTASSEDIISTNSGTRPPEGSCSE